VNDVQSLAISEANGYFRDFTRQAYAAWDCFNVHLFEGALSVPFIKVDKFNCAWGGCHMPGYFPGVKSTILIEAEFITRCGMRSRFFLARLILLHEMVHQYLYECKGQRCGRDGAHSYAFACLCNALSAKAGLL
jgi:hypothetical protein